MEQELNGAMQSVSINSSTASSNVVANGDCCNIQSNGSAAAAMHKSSANGQLCTASGGARCSEQLKGGYKNSANASANASANVNANASVSVNANTNANTNTSADTTDNARVCSSAALASAAYMNSIGGGGDGGGGISFSCKSSEERQVQTTTTPQTEPEQPFYASASVAEKRKMVHELCQQLLLTDEQILELNYRVLHEIKKGLSKDTHEKANVKCFVTYVQDLPNGNERGKFLALDLGGTNFRVLLIQLKEDHDFQMESRIYAIPQHIMIGSGTQLFDHIAECLANFMNEHDVYKERLPLGFTFSFPLQQLGLTKGLLVTWTKGFDCAGVVNEDVVQLLKDAIARRGDVQIDVCAILNDTTGTLMSCAWKNRNCKIGLIVGTGSNACYVERVEEAELFEESVPGKSHVLINTEWGALGDNGALNFLRTEFDDEVDTHSINPGKQLFEKMISGMYMGELVRLVIVKMVKAGVLFKGQNSDVLMTRGQFFTKYVSEIEADEPGTYTNCRLVLEELGLNSAADEDCANVRYICECVSKRAAHLVSCGIATLINKMDEPAVTVGVDGSVYRFHPKFHNLMVEKITQLVKPGITFDLMLSEDGSGRGAALVAAVACREDYPKK